MAYADKVITFYHSKEWQAVRIEVLRRDKGLCQVCLKHGHVTLANTVHHIQPIRTFKNGKNIIAGGWDKRLDPSNLEAICASCHNKEHPEKGMDKQQRIHHDIIKRREKNKANVFKIN